MKHKLNTDRMNDIYKKMMQVATRFERRKNNAKNDKVVLYCTNVQCILNDTVIVFFVDFCVCPIIVPYPANAS